MDMALIEFDDRVHDKRYDLQVPTFITGRDFVTAMNKAYNLGLNPNDEKTLYFRAVRPIAMIAGDRKLSDLGVADGTCVIFERGTDRGV